MYNSYISFDGRNVEDDANWHKKKRDFPYADIIFNPCISKLRQ